MLDLQIDYSEYSIMIQALLNRMDFLSSMVARLSENPSSEMYSLYKDDFEFVHALYLKLRRL